MMTDREQDAYDLNPTLTPPHQPVTHNLYKPGQPSMG